MLTVLYLVYVEIVILHTICPWCTGVHGLIFGSLLVAMIDAVFSEQREKQEAEEESVVGHPPRC